ncbi:sigma-54 interaction domain-containing protein [Halorhodospira neutriphila]|uniref:Sigma-54-dependent Fis family transcriptional regulator n=1 Tax=Halorhodospira neutriphila TaxID=168379 RepID=A0ABS1E518_9GAMM|nr:sigma-54 dependent transcriptional regulator [Halorhodospira neutriphila]MBK1726187.1 sigma-54-dependent Fis family transcriptional regulator [Halorhodospira neutriphila]
MERHQALTASESTPAPYRAFSFVPEGARPEPRFEPVIDQWSLTPVSRAAEIDALLADGVFPVGVMWVRHDTLEECQRFLMATEGVEWIALVEGDVWQAGEALRRTLATAFFDFHTLPADGPRLALSLGHAAGMARLRSSLRAGPASGGPEAAILGDSPPIRALRRDLYKVAGHDATVLIRGESGSGKELAAREIHNASPRAEGSFVAVNCGAIPDNLVQSELFGHERGAFTGAHQRRRGHLELADGGTIFLDEVAELSLEHQVNLLRVLEERTLVRVGGTERIPVDMRVVAATHVDLERAVAEGRFREDLFYRLNVLPIEVPPLRARAGDIEQLARHFLERFHHEQGTAARAFSAQALGALKRHDWPGNIRELLNRIQRAAVMSDHRLLTPADLGLEARRLPWRDLETLEQARTRAERDAVQAALVRCGNNVSEASRQLGVARVTLYRLLERLNLQQ